MEKLYGIDVSHHNWEKITWQQRVNIGVTDFTIMKATEGRTMKDYRLDDWYNKVHHSRDGKPDTEALYGFYHYAHPELNSAKSEADNFLNCVGHHAGYCMYVLDYEGKALQYKDMDWALEWLYRVEKETGVKPLFYCQASFTKYLKPLYDKNYGLWVAHYNRAKPETGAYPFYAMHQYIDKPFDLNVFNGGKEQFRDYCKQH